MKSGIFVALLGCTALSFWAWTSRSGSAPPGDSLPLAAIPAPTLDRPAVEDPTGRSALPLPATAGLLPTDATAAMPVGLRLQSSPIAAADAERIARRFYHAQVEVEELEKLLPPDQKLAPRTRESFPGYSAAQDTRNAQGELFAGLPPPAEHEALPALDMGAEGDDFERIYGNWTREDLLVENWRLGRFAAAESSRLIDAEARRPAAFGTQNGSQAAVFG